MVQYNYGYLSGYFWFESYFLNNEIMMRSKQFLDAQVDNGALARLLDFSLESCQFEAFSTLKLKQDSNTAILKKRASMSTLGYISV